MPNHVVQEVVISGDDSTLDEIEKFVGGYEENEYLPFSLNEIVPQPDDIIQESIVFGIDYDGRDWYTWNTKNWGTKWNAYNQERVRESGRLIFRFETAWSPPHPVMEVLAAEFPKACIEHAMIDEGWNFAGIVFYENGEVVEERLIDCSENDEFMDLHHRIYGEYPETELDWREW